MRIGISGHRDLDDDTAAKADAGIRALLAERAGTDLTGVSCLADGSDQIFARAVLDAGRKLIVIIPAAEYRDRLPETSHEGYDALLSIPITVVWPHGAKRRIRSAVAGPGG